MIELYVIARSDDNPRTPILCVCWQASELFLSVRQSHAIFRYGSNSTPPSVFNIPYITS